MKSQRKINLRVGTHVCPSSQALHWRGPFQASDTYTDPGKAPRAPWTLEFRPPCLRLQVPLTPQRGGPKSRQLQRKGKRTSLAKTHKRRRLPSPHPVPPQPRPGNSHSFIMPMSIQRLSLQAWQWRRLSLVMRQSPLKGQVNSAFRFMLRLPRESRNPPLGHPPPSPSARPA